MFGLFGGIEFARRVRRTSVTKCRWKVRWRSLRKFTGKQFDAVSRAVWGWLLSWFCFQQALANGKLAENLKIQYESLMQWKSISLITWSTSRGKLKGFYSTLISLFIYEVKPQNSNAWEIKNAITYDTVSFENS